MTHCWCRLTHPAKGEQEELEVEVHRGGDQTQGEGTGQAFAAMGCTVVDGALGCVRYRWLAMA